MNGSRPLSEQEVHDYLDALACRRDRLLALTALTFGTRISETLALTFGDAGGDHVFIRSAKGSENVTFPVPGFYQEAVKALAEEYRAAGIVVGDKTALFLSRNAVRRAPKAMTPRQAENILRSAAKKIGLSGKVTGHSLRKTFIRKIFDATGKDIVETKRYSRHKSLASLDFYLSTATSAHHILDLDWGRS